MHSVMMTNTTDWPSTMKKSSIEDYIAAQDAENGTNMSAWLTPGDWNTPKTPKLDDESQAIVDKINAKAHARSLGRMEAVKNGAPPRTESEREFARINKMIRKLEKPTLLDRIRAALK